MISDDTQVWTIIVGVGVGTYLIRFGFLGLVGDRVLPVSVLRHLRYTGVAVIPGLVAPLIAWPNATGGDPDPARLAAAAATLAVAYVTRSVIWAVLAGAGTLYGAFWIF